MLLSRMQIDTSPGKQFFHRLAYCLVLLFFTAAVFSPAKCEATNRKNEGKIIFFPIKITYTENNNNFTKDVDTIFSKAFRKTGIEILERIKAESLADYKGSWPPPTPLLEQIARKTGANVIITGNLILLGDQISCEMKIFDTSSPEYPELITNQGEGLENLPQTINGVADLILGFTDTKNRVISIRPKGNNRIDSGKILRHITTKVGTPFNPLQLREDLKAIHKMGYFEDVQIETEDSSEGKIITFTVVEKPVIDSLIIEGAEELDDEVKEIITIEEKSILNEAKINETVEILKAFYKSKGYYDADIKSSITFPTPGNAVVKFDIDEKEKVHIKKIIFSGNVTFDDQELEDVIKTKEHWFMSWLTSAGVIKPDQIRQDASRIGAFYHNNGFLEVKVGDPEITETNGTIEVTFEIEEGPRFLVGTVGLEGELPDEKEKLLKLLKIRKNKFISGKILREDKNRIYNFYAQKGYADAEIDIIMRKSTSGKRIDVVFGIEKKELVYINRITITGNTKTRDNVIRRDLTLKEGSIFNTNAKASSGRALERLSFFDSVNITVTKTDDESSTVDVNIDIEEKNTGSFSVGVGYSSVDKLVFSGQISQNNFLGRGDTLSLNASLSESSSKYKVAYTNPRFNDSRLSTGFEVFNTERKYDDYTKESVGGAIKIGYPLWEKIRLYGTYSYIDTDLTNVSENASYVIQQSVNIHVTSAIKFSLVRDTRNRRYGATDGSRNLLSVKYAGGPFSGDAQFTKVEASSSWYFPLPGNTSFHIKGAAGQVFENEDDKLPVYERFYLGGLRTIRGFEYGKISPRDPETNERIGGEKMWYSNVEFIFPLVKKQGLNGVIFYDMGKIFDDDKDWEFDDPKKAAGVEIRWLSPVGPLRLVWGFNLDPADDEDDSVWDFTVGGTF